MALSEDLASVEAYLASCVAGTLPFDRVHWAELRNVLGLLADRAAVIERALADTAEQLSPSRDRAALIAGLRSGKVALLAAHRVERLPDLDQPGWIA